MDTAQTTMPESRLKRQQPGLLLYLLIFTVCAFSTACKSADKSANSEPHAADTPAKTSQEKPIAPAANVAAPEPPPAEALELPPPKPEEVQAVLARVYKEAVTIDARRSPIYVVGDFNGDDSQDIAVVVRPAKEKLEEINSEVANWILEDPRRVVLPDPQKGVQQLPPNPGPVKVQAADVLLTIIHGYKQEGWRNPEARQAYLLSNAVGNSMTAEPIQNLQSATVNKSVLSKSANVIKQTLGGAEGFIYWTGAKYAWHKKQG